MVAVENLAEFLLEQLSTRDLVRVSASEAEYLDIAPEFPGKLEYHNGEIIAMSLATAFHELIVSAPKPDLPDHLRAHRPPRQVAQHRS